MPRQIRLSLFVPELARGLVAHIRSCRNPSNRFMAVTRIVNSPSPNLPRRAHMDPNLFHLDWEQLGEVLATIVVVAFIVERALSLMFENKIYVQKLGDKPVKEIIAFAGALIVCWRWQLDGLSVILHGNKITFLG